MPIYEYECQVCSNVFEKRQSFNDPPVADCPKCDSDETRRLISAPAIVFKGKGFYVTDSKNGSNSVGTTTNTDGKSDEKSETKSDKKSDTTESSTAKSETKSADTKTKTATKADT